MLAANVVLAETSLAGWPAWAAPLLRGLLWLDATHARYWTLTAALLLATTWWAWRELVSSTESPAAGWRFWVNSAGFWLLAAVTLFAGRWPEVFVPIAFNADENLFLAQALTAAGRDAVPWRGFEGHTAGPLNAYALLPAAWLGFPLRYVSARLTALALELGSVACVAALARRAFGARVGRFAALPALAFFTLTNFNDFVFYSSEHVPAFLAALGFLLTAGLLWANSARRLFLQAGSAGFVLGLAPYAKLQAAPVAAATALAGLVFLQSRHEFTRAVRWRAAGVFIAGGAAFTGLLVCVLLRTGVFVDFINSYLRMQLEYIGNPTPHFWRGLLERVPDFWCFFVPAAILALVGGVIVFRSAASNTTRLLLGGALAVLAASFYEVRQPHRDYGHYLFLALFPMAALSACVFAALDQNLRAGARTTRLAVAAGYLTCSLLPLIVLRAGTEHPYLGQFNEYLERPPIPVLARLRDFTRPGEPLAVWGWMAECQVFTATTLGTRDPQCEHQMLPGRLRGYYRRRYLADLKKIRPPVFMDAVAPVAAGFQDRAVFGLETFPELARYVGENYALRDEVQGVRIFVRKDIDRP
ncbi:MAG: hypothetical protein JO295_06370 [Verrucomicrobia bacterium]|nr:hypothetical protein [Verrucomicrobiota bacterium]